MEVVNAIIDFLKTPGVISLLAIGTFMSWLRAKAR